MPSNHEASESTSALTTSLASLLPWWDPPARYAKQTHRRPHRCYPEKTRYPRVPRCRLGVVKILAIVSGWEDFLVHNSKPTYELYKQLTFMAGCYGFLKKNYPQSSISRSVSPGQASPSLKIKKSQRYLSRPSLQKSSTKTCHSNLTRHSPETSVVSDFFRGQTACFSLNQL